MPEHVDVLLDELQDARVEEREARQKVRDLVRRSRKAGAKLQEIADVLEVSPQAVHERLRGRRSRTAF